MNKLILIFSFILINTQSFSIEKSNSIHYSRTNVSLVADDNKLVININDDGSYDLKYPQFHKYSGKNIKLQNLQKSDLLFINTKNINFDWNSTQLKERLLEAKGTNNNSLFHSSENDIIQLQLFNNQQLLWEITIDNLNELKHFYDDLGELHYLVDLINAIESLSRTDEVAKQLELLK